MFVSMIPRKVFNHESFYKKISITIMDKHKVEGTVFNKYDI